MKTKLLTILLPAVLLTAALAVSNAQKGNKEKPKHADKITASLPAKAPAKPKTTRKVLVFSKTAGFRHRDTTALAAVPGRQACQKSSRRRSGSYKAGRFSGRGGL